MNINDRIEYLRKKGSEKRASFRWYKRWWAISLFLVIGSFLVYVFSFIFLFFHFKANPSEAELAKQLNNTENIINTTSTENEAVKKILESQGNYYLGSDNPQYTLVVFSDFACSYCKKTSEVIALLTVKYGDKIKIIVRDYPIISEDSADLAMGAWCAGEQGKYWPMYYKLFELQGTFSVSNLSLVAKEAGVTDINKFSDCLYNQKYLNNIKKDFSDGQYLEITGTPNWYINGIKISSGYISFDNWATLLDKILK